MVLILTTRRQRRLAVLLVSVGLCVGQPARAQPAAPAVAFDEAIGLSQRTPRVLAMERSLRVRREEDRKVAGGVQATQVTVMPGVNWVPEPEPDTFEVQVNVTQSWNLGRLGRRARDAARSERAGLSARSRAQALTARLDAAKAWLDLRTLESVDGLLEQANSIAERYVRESEYALEAGAHTRADVARAEALAAEIAEQSLDVHGARFDAATALSLALGRELPDTASHAPPLSTRGPIPQPEVPDESSLASYASRVNALPEVAAERLASLSAQARELEAAAQYAPLLQTGFQVEHAGDTWVAYGILGATFRNNGDPGRALSIARAEAARSAGEAEARALEARGHLAYAWHEVEHERRREAPCHDRLLPSLNDLAQRNRESFESGAGTVFEWLDAERRKLEAQTRCAWAGGASAWARVRLWLLLATLEENAQ